MNLATDPVDDIKEDPTSDPSPEPKSEPKDPVDWKTSLPEDLRGEPSLQQIKDIGALAQSYVHAQKAIGADKITLPKEYWGEEEWGQFYSKLGRPQTPEEYGIEAPKDADPEFTKWYLETAHKAGLSKTQANTLFSQYNEFMEQYASKQGETVDLQREKQIVELKNEWGSAFQSKFQDARTIFQKYLPEDVQKAFEQRGLSGDPMFVKAMAKIAEATLTEDERVHGPEGKPAKSPADADAEIAMIRGDAAHPFNNPQHPGHKAARAEMDRLYEIKAGAL